MGGKHKPAVIGKTYFEHGKPVVVLAKWNGNGPRNVLISREDGTKVVRPFRGLRKKEVKRTWTY
jgi:acetyl esterase